MNTLLVEDKELKRVARSPKTDKPQFEWSALAASMGDKTTSTMKVNVGGNERDFDLGEIADTVGNAITDLLLARHRQSEIFNDQNRQLVQAISVAVAEELRERAANNEGGASALSRKDIHRAIERALVKHNAHDVARSLAERRKRLDAEEFDSSLPQPTLVTTKVIRRNGQLVPWNHDKIEIAVRKAFLSLEMDSSPAVQVAEAVSATVAADGKGFMHIEDVQNIVEEELMRQGFFKVARAYIQYRALRNKMREVEEEAAAIANEQDSDQQQSLILVQVSSTETFLWDGQDLKRRIDFASLGLDLCLTRTEIEMELRRSIFTEITTVSLKDTIILNARTLMEKDADFAKFAGRILLSYIYEEVLGWDIVRDGIEQLPHFHRRAFRRNLSRCIEIERVHPQLLKYDLNRLADALDPAADMDFDFLGIQTLYDRYLLVDKKVTPAKRLEAPQLFWMRVAMGLCIEEKENPEEKIIALYKLYKGRRFCSSTPTLFNSGTMHSQLSSCYLYKVDDSIESIMYRGIAENAFLSKWAGGLGGSWTAVRGTGGYIKGTNGESQGVIPFLKLHNDQLVAVNQGGKRRGSGCAYLEVWHNDIYDFLELKVNTGDERRRTHDLNTANWIPDLFMKRLEAREDWTLFRSNEVPDLHELYGSAFQKRYTHYEAKAEAGEIFGRKVKATDLWRAMLGSIFETSHPWITFKDPCNVRSPQDHVGVIHSSNLCTEITLNTSADETAVCNLGSILIDNHLEDSGGIDHTKLRETIRVAVRMLDNVIDINYYPTEPARTANTRHRPIGLGVMGLGYALYRKGIPFASKEAVEFNDEFMEAVAYYAYEASSDIAAEKGTYSTYKGSKWDRGLLPQDTLDLLAKERGMDIDCPRGGKMDWSGLRAKIAKQGMRNSNVLAIAPTATISNIMGSSPCIEPLFTNFYTKGNLSGKFTVLNPYLVKDLKKRGLWNPDIQARIKYTDGELESIEEIPLDLKRKYATAFGIDWAWLIDAAARRQKWIDQSQSVNLFCGEGAMQTLSHMYRAAWRKGLKTTYYLRTKSASNIEKATSEVEKEKRGIVGQVQSATAAANLVPKREYTAEEVAACDLNAMRTGGTCEACQ